MNSKRAAIILAAGKGKRMKSDLPKVLHKVHGKSMIQVIVNTLQSLDFERIVVIIGHGGELVRKELANQNIEFAEQTEQLGTGDAVKMAREQLKDFDGITLVAAGDVPFLSGQTIERLLAQHESKSAHATCLSAILVDPTGYGRIIRDDNSENMIDIVEHKDASEEVRSIKEINSGTFCFGNKVLWEVIDEIGCDNVQNEYYLTDTVKLLHNKGMIVSVIPAENPDEVRGVNSVEQLKELEELFPQ